MQRQVMGALALACLVFVGCCPSFEKGSARVALVDNGVAKCRVVVAENASKPEKFGAKDLAKYLAKSTGCGELDGAYPIVLD